MKQINKLFVLISMLSSLAFISCENLDQDPANQLSINKAFRNIDDAEAWVNQYYANLRSSFGNIEIYGELQADVFNASTIYGNQYGTLHSWQIQTSDAYVESIWKNLYSLLADINLCIEKFPTVPVSSAREQQLIQQYLGESYMLRAYYYLKLVEHFSPKYTEANKNEADLGVPLVLTYNVTNKPARATLEATFDQIYTDIERAKTLLANKPNALGAISFTLDGTKALEARVALTKGDYQRAYNVATELIRSNRYPLVTDRATLSKIWKDDEKDESIVQLFASSDSKELPPNRTLFLGYSLDNRKYTPLYTPSQWVVDLYEANDNRRDVYIKELPCFLSGELPYTATLAYKYPQSKYATTVHNGHAPKIFRIAEQYLIAAEAAYKLGNEDNARTKLNDLKTARGASNIPTSTTGTALFEEIKSERLRELAFEGFRLIDLKRWGDPVRRHDPQNVNYISSSPSDQFYELNKPATHYMFVWPIPFNDLQTNKNIKQNPGY